MYPSMHLPRGVFQHTLGQGIVDMVGGLWTERCGWGVNRGCTLEFIPVYHATLRSFVIFTFYVYFVQIHLLKSQYIFVVSMANVIDLSNKTSPPTNQSTIQAQWTSNNHTYDF